MCFREYEVSFVDGISDHKLVPVTVTQNSPPQKQKKNTALVYNFAKADDTTVLDYLEYPLDSFRQDANVESPWNHFKEAVNYCLTMYVPQKIKKD